MFTRHVTVRESDVGYVMGKGKKNIKHLMDIFTVTIKYKDECFVITSETSEGEVITVSGHIRMMIRNKLMKEVQCPICLLDIDNSKNITTTKCGHHFHSECLHSCLKTKNSCPLCREPLVETNTRLTKRKIGDITNKVLTNLTYNGYFYRMVYYMSTESYINCNSVSTIREMMKEPISMALTEANKEFT
jgi:hypothetical protein